MATGQPRRTVCCEEWGTITIGLPGAPLSFDEIGGIFRQWKAQTGTEPSLFFDFRGNKLTPKNWSGVAPGDGVQLEVSPIGSTGLSSEQRQALDLNISLMLQAALTGGSLEMAEGELGSSGQRLQAILAAFCRDLVKARRHQVIRRYSLVRMATRCIRGRTVFPAQVFESIRRPGYFASEWVALDEDTAENRFIKAVLALFRPRACGNLRYQLDDLLCQYEGVQLPASALMEWRRIRFDRLSREYSRLLELGKALIDGEFPGLFSGMRTATTEIVFTAKVFESFVGVEVSRLAESRGYIVKRQPRGQHLGTWKGGAFDGRKVFELVPDIQLIRGGAEPRSLVIDTKWKRLTPTSAQYGISIDDVYQVVTYAVRFGHTHGILVYPWIGEGNPLGDAQNVTMPLATSRGTIHITVAYVPMLEAGFPNLYDGISQLLDHAVCG